MPLTRNTPKSLIDIGDGHTLLERQLKFLADGGVEEATILTGYESRQIEATVADLSSPKIEIGFNPLCKSVNNPLLARFGLGGWTKGATIRAGQVTEPIECAQDEWAEIDFHPDVAFERSVVARTTVINDPT